MSVQTSEHISTVISYLNGHADYAVLRNYEGLPDNNSSRDIDIIIDRQSWKKSRHGFHQLIADHHWRIVNYLDSDRLITYVLSVGDGKTELVQWDFFMNTSVWGIQLMDAHEFLQHKEWNGFLYYVGVECQFLDKYLYNRSVGSPYPEKYAATKEEAKDLPFVKEKLKAVFGINSVEEGDQVAGRGLIRRAFFWNIRKRPWALCVDMMRFAYTFVRNYLFSETGFSVGFTGPDGSGKTTVIEMLLSELGDVFRKAHAYYHFRPTLFGNISDVAHSAGLKKEVDKNYDKPHRGNQTSKASSVIRLCYYTLDYIIGYLLKVKTLTRITRIVVFDRYYSDIICDSRRSRIYLNKRWLYWWGRMLIPRLDYNILLTASTDTILSRKQELDRQEVESIKEAIDYLAGKPGYLKVENDGMPEEAVQKILHHILDRQDKKNRRRLKF
jgi:thymidylate kinase